MVALGYLPAGWGYVWGWGSRGAGAERFTLGWTQKPGDLFALEERRHEHERLIAVALRRALSRVCAKLGGVLRF